MNHRYLTEEGIAIKTIYIPNLTISVSKVTLCRYFSQFGAVYHARVVSERLKLYDIMHNLDAGPNDAVANIPPDKYYAYVTFVNEIGAAEALRKYPHIVEGVELEVEQAFTWNQPQIDVEKYLTENVQPTSLQKERLYQAISDGLIDDCIWLIMSYMNVFELEEMAKFNERFHCIAKGIKQMNICHSTVDKLITLMELRSILHLRGFGHSVTDLTISRKSFSPMSQRHICSRLFQYIGPQIRKLTLKSFGVTNTQFDLMKPLLRCLEYLDIDINFTFNYSSFKCVWPSLEELRIRSTGNINIAQASDTLKAPEFKKLKKLMIETTYRLHTNLFKNWHEVCPKLTELVIINEDDYYCQRSQMQQYITDVKNVKLFTELTTLHLSFSRTYFIENIIEVISENKKLKHLTLEIVHPRDRPREDHIFIEFNQNLRHLGVNLKHIEDISFSSISLDEDRVIDLIKNAPKLEKLTIFEPGFTFEVPFIRNIINARKFILENRQIIQLKLTVAEFADEVIQNVLEEEETIRYLKVFGTSKNVINKNYTFSKEETPRALVRNANYRRIRFGNDPRERDPFRLRNRLFLFRP